MRILFFSAIFVVSLFANAYKEGMAYFKMNNYEEAYKKLDSVLFENIGQDEFNLVYGKVALELGHYNDAIAAFERVLTKNEKNYLARFSLGKAYYEIGQYKLASGEFSLLVKGVNVPKEVQEASKDYLAAIKNKEIAHRYSLKAVLGIESDSNINNGNDFSIFGNEINPETSSSAYDANLEFSYLYQGKKNLFKAVGGYSAKEVSEERAADYSYPYLSLIPIFNTDTYYIQTPITFLSLNYNDENVLNQYILRGDFIKKKPLSGFSRTAYYIESGSKVYNSANKSKDSNFMRLGTNFSQNFGDKLVLSYSGNFGFERRVEGRNVDVSHDSFSLGLTAQYKYTKNLQFLGITNINIKNFTETDYLEQEKRADKILSIGGKTVYSLNNNSGIIGRVNYLKNSSNIERIGYDKMTMGISYQYLFAN